ncbi:MAG: hypothetical protein EAY66_07885 [Sphingobacteriales bacterium]|nr:MAG: hypothetical protein EAY66_07885 [Sphingobacteriales bacterium]
MKKIKLLAILNFIFYLAAFSVSWLSQLKLFNNQNNAQVSAKYETLFTPAGLTFSIWWLIYLSLFGFVIYHAISAFKDDYDSEANKALRKINYLFVINNIATAFWIFAFSYEYLGLSLIFIIVQLLTLLLIALKLNLYSPHKSIMSRLFTQIPLSIYFAWLCIATIANFSVYLVSINWVGNFNAETWVEIMIWSAVVLAVFMDIKKKNPYFGLVFMWALYGIQLKRAMIDAVLYREIILNIWVALAIIGLTVIIRFIINFMNKSFVETTS